MKKVCPCCDKIWPDLPGYFAPRDKTCRFCRSKAQKDRTGGRVDISQHTLRAKLRTIRNAKKLYDHEQEHINAVRPRD